MRKAEGGQLPAAHKSALRSDRIAFRIGLLLLMLAVLVLFSGERRSESSWAFPLSLVDRQRYGFIATSTSWRDDFDVAQLGAGCSIHNAVLREVAGEWRADIRPGVS